MLLQAISERIKELDIQDCKVRVTNVDSQESGRDIVVQVIGEMSNKSAPHRKFVQTFILAEQPNGYYVLNDIFRYIADDEEEEEVEEQPTQPEFVEAPPQEPETHGLTSESDEAAQGKDVEMLDKKLEETAADPQIQPSAVSAPANGDEASVEVSEVANTAASAKPDYFEAEPEAPEDPDIAMTEEAAVEPELPKDPQPTLAPSPKPSEEPQISPAPPVEEAAAPPKPAAPKTWASMVAGPKAPIPAVPQVSAAAPAAPQHQPKATPQPVPAPVSTAAATTEEALPSPGGWQTAGQDHSKKQGRQQSGSISGGAADKNNVSAYIKNVYEKVDAAALKTTLSKYGKLDYFDVSRAKVCTPTSECVVVF